MTETPPQPRRGRALFPAIPRGEVVATFEAYSDAQAAVDRLARAEFPVREVSIVGSDLKSVENVTGARSYPRAALSGALSGLWVGIFLGLLFVLLDPESATLPFVGAAALIGAGFGMFFNIVVYSLSRRRRDFTSVMQVVASSYSVIVSPEHASRARAALDAPPAP
ncbi:general stress protein [Herbiconiux liukaitaii]|uniref:general stress protein n=1 Tax=Herbiconiux liukaitaii TaxID=3342799 RepID=UPI0035BAD859